MRFRPIPVACRLFVPPELPALAWHAGAKKLFTQLEEWSKGPLAKELGKEGFADF